MMTTNGHNQAAPRKDVATGPKSNLMFGGRVQNEAIALASRRAQAYLELPQTVARCRSPQDLLTAQVMFWQIAQRHYAQGLETILGVSPLGAITAAVSGFAMPGPAAAAISAPVVPSRARDYLVVAEGSKPTTNAAHPATLTSGPVSPARIKRSA
jgi:hypothetical protein